MVVKVRVALLRDTNERCHRCGKPIKKNQRIVSKPSGRDIRRKLYHEECWESLFIEI